MSRLPHESTPRPLVFLWENFGPYHIDRLEAVARGERPVIGIEFAQKSATYAWKRESLRNVEIRSLFGDGETISKLALAWRLLRECLRIRRADFFLCHYEEWAVLLSATVLRLLGRRVFTMIESKFDDYQRRVSIELIKTIFVAPYNGVLTPTLRSRDYMSFLGFPPDKIALGYSTVSIDRIVALSGVPPAPDGTAFAERDFVIVARLVPKKNIAMALDAFALWLEQTARPRKLRLCGSGPLEQDLRAQADRLGIAEQVVFHGFVQTAEVSRQLARGLCLLLPSVEEQFGLVVIEAQAVGLPVLAARNVGACDILIDPGINGFVLDPMNPASCAALMLMLSDDEPLWRRFATAARDGRYRGDTVHFAEGVRRLTGDAFAGRSADSG